MRQTPSAGSALCTHYNGCPILRFFLAKGGVGKSMVGDLRAVRLASLAGLGQVRPQKKLERRAGHQVFCRRSQIGHRRLYAPRRQVILRQPVRSISKACSGVSANWNSSISLGVMAPVSTSASRLKTLFQYSEP